MKIQQLSLIKEEHKYVFRYLAGKELELIGTFIEMAGDKDNDFDWYDAVVLTSVIDRAKTNEFEKFR